MNYRIVRISKNVEEYPDCADDTAEFPHLVRHIQDEMDIFVVLVGQEAEKFWPASEFFLMVSASEFTITKE